MNNIEQIVKQASENAITAINTIINSSNQNEISNEFLDYFSGFAYNKIESFGDDASDLDREEYTKVYDEYFEVNPDYDKIDRVEKSDVMRAVYKCLFWIESQIGRMKIPDVIETQNIYTDIIEKVIGNIEEHFKIKEEI